MAKPLTQPPARKRRRPIRTPRQHDAGQATRAHPAPPTRRCLATGEICPKDALIRFVVGPDDEVVPDLAERLPGRGLWLTAERACLERAVSRNLFSRAAKQPLKTSPDLPETVHRLLRERCLSGLGLLYRAGAVTAGFAKVSELLTRGSACFVIEARDGAEDGRRKILKLAGTPADGLERAPWVIGCFSAEEIGLAIGRENVVHAAGSPTGMSERWLVGIRRLRGFEPLLPENWSQPGGGPGRHQPPDGP